MHSLIIILVLGVIFVTGEHNPNHHSVIPRYIKNNVKNAIKSSDKDNYKEVNKEWKFRSRGDFLKENEITFRDDEDEYIKIHFLENPTFHTGKGEFSGSGSGSGSTFKGDEEPPNYDDYRLQGSGSHGFDDKEVAEVYIVKHKEA
jgi:hypothetical protein